MDATGLSSTIQETNTKVKKTEDTTDKREKRLAYYKRYREEHKEQTRMYTERYWKKKLQSQ